MYASGNRKNAASVITGPITTPLEAPMLDSATTSIMIASIVAK